MTAKDAYYQFIAELAALEASTGMYLSDTCVDREDVSPEAIPESEAFYKSLLACATSAAGSRAEERGQDINKLLGRIVY
jgi:hypothetical protein